MYKLCKQEMQKQNKSNENTRFSCRANKHNNNNKV